MGSAKALGLIESWMSARGTPAFPFQKRVWRACLSGKSGLLHSPTGTGKTLAVWLGAISTWLSSMPRNSSLVEPKRTHKRIKRNTASPLTVIWITPLRALATDTLNALQEPVATIGIPWTVEKRTSDSSSTERAKQLKRLPSAIVTTPESMSLLLSHPETQRQLTSTKFVILDEWHELIGSKRGVQTELCLARLRKLNPSLQTWAVSATVGNVEQAMRTAMGTNSSDATLIKAPNKRKSDIESLIPDQIERFPWAGHMGLKSIDAVVKQIDKVGSTIVFTNTRSQAENWYAAILHAKPDWAGRIGVHHGSLDRKKRSWVEQQLDEGNLKCVVATSSLDLGVDFLPVEQVLQIGSPKGVARLLQRAGRSGHYPGGRSRMTMVPTHALELIEIAAAKTAIKHQRIESRVPLENSLDVLAQHLITLACGTTVDTGHLFGEVRSTCAFRELTDEQWQWVLDFAIRGGPSLEAYPDFQRLKRDGDLVQIANSKLARRHRMTIGTIASDREITVQFLKGSRLGTIEETFISKLQPGDKFTFGGRTLKLVQVKDMTAWVRRSTGRVAALPRWHGGRMPLSSQLSEAVRDQLELARTGRFIGPEMRAARDLLTLQAQWSDIPSSNSTLIECVKTRDGYHTFVFPFEGRLVHEGLGAILAWRISRLQPITFATTINDYGIELLSATPPPLEQALAEGLFSTTNLRQHIQKSMNAAELDRRQFRDIARVAGLVFGGFPGEGKSSKQLQASSNMFFDVFTQYDPENLLLKQARFEVLELQLEYQRLCDAMERINQSQVILNRPPKPTPLAFPIMVDRLRTRLSSERLAERISRLTKQFEKAANSQ